ncbi:MAG TPA: stage II sporulation protein P [Candidatus Merdisoma merdipullorum]|nr:stage II sporulation protein P [Candidatus Merdisoma merdipullorum]
MNRLQKIINGIVWLVIGILGLYILGYGIKGQSFSKAAYACMKVLTNAEGDLQNAAAKCLYPGLAFVAGEPRSSASFDEFLIRKAMGIFPLFSFMDGQELYETETESAVTYEILIQGGAHDENEIDIQTGEAFDIAEKVEEENLRAAQEEQEALEQERREQEAEGQAEGQTDTALAVQSGEVLGTEYTMEQLSDFDFLKNNFYIVESNTDISSDLLNAETLLGMDMTMQQDNSAPQILIYHTHSQEGFVDSVPGDNSTTIVGVGEYLAEILRETYGYNVIHNTNVYDFIDGELDRNQAYTLAEADVQQILAENPSIEVIIDLHRDGVQEDTHLVTEINGKPTAQFMFFNGLSFSKRNGPIDYLQNPYIGENLALSLQLKLACEKYYPGLSRKVYLKSLRYNLHLRPKSLLVEAGAQTNTVEEMLNAMEPLAYILNQVLKNP